MDTELQFDEKTYRVVLEKTSGATGGSIDGEPLEGTIRRITGNAVTVEIDGKRHRAWVARNGERLYVHLGGRQWMFEEASAALDRAAGAGAGGFGGNTVASSMPGKVVKLLVSEGDEVEEGAPLVIVEAMKMETPLPSPASGTVKKVHFAEGDLVDAGQPIVELEIEEPDTDE